MAYSSARKTILIGKEVTWGTAVTADKDIGIVQDITDSGTREVDEVKGLGKVETQQVNTGNATGATTMTIKVQNGRLLEYALGTVAHAETTGDWKHTFSVSTTPPSMTIESSEDGSTDTSRTYPGHLIEKLEMKVDQTDGLTFKADTKGKVYTSSATTAAAVIDNLIVFPKSLVTVSIGGAAATETQEASIIFNKTVALVPGTGSVDPQDGEGVELAFEFTAKVGYDNKTFQELFLGGTSIINSPAGFEFEIDADNGTSLGSGQRRVKCTLENCQMNKNDVTATIGDIVFLEVGGHGTLKANECFSVDDIADTAWS